MGWVDLAEGMPAERLSIDMVNEAHAMTELAKCFASDTVCVLSEGLQLAECSEMQHCNGCKRTYAACSLSLTNLL